MPAEASERHGEMAPGQTETALVADTPESLDHLLETALLRLEIEERIGEAGS